MQPTLSLKLVNYEPNSSQNGWKGLFDRAVAADRAGVDRVLVVDHVVMGQHIDMYDGGHFPTGPQGAWLEPLTVLSVVCGMTTRIRLGTSILIAALRRPVTLAKTAATLDVLSEGRLDIGVGVGWQREEYEAAGLRFERRGQLLDETLSICKALWGKSPTDFASPNLRFENIWCEPKPVQPGGIPIWVGGRLHQTNLQRIVRFADGWIPWGEYRTEIESGIDEVRRALSDANRDPSTFQIRHWLPVVLSGDGTCDVAATMMPVPGLAKRGVTDFSIQCPLKGDREAITEELTSVVSGFRDSLE